MSMNKSYDRTAVVECIDNDKSIDADVLTFVEGKYLTVAINTVKVNLQYNQKHSNYIGSLGGLEFRSVGPRTLGYYR
jgi:hypothetical protein